MNPNNKKTEPKFRFYYYLLCYFNNRRSDLVFLFF